MNNVHISKMTGKLDGFQAISTNTMTNPFCIKQNASGKADNICTKCYSHTMLKSYRKNMQPSLQRNSDLLSEKVLDHNQLPTILNAFLRFNAHFLSEIFHHQPSIGKDNINRLEYRPLEGFIFTISPFNFTAIASNLNTSVAIMGNTTV